MRIYQADMRAAEARRQEELDRAQKVWEAAARAWQEAVREAAEWHSPH